MATDTRIRATHPRVPEPISSRDNRWLKLFRAALAGAPLPRSLRTGGEIAAVEGHRLVDTALQSGVETLAVLVSESGARHLAALEPFIPTDARLLSTSDRLFAQTAVTEAPQGIAALVRPRPAAFDELVSGTPLIAVLAGVQDPGNVGAIIRTADAFGACGVAACAAGGIGTADPFGAKALRASAGSALRLPVLRAAAAPVLLAQLRVAGLRLYAACPEDRAHPGKAVAPWEADWRGPAALLLGNEGSGLPEEVIRSADAVVCIPQAAAAGAESLNAAVAAGILLYEAARQRGLAQANA